MHTYNYSQLWISDYSDMSKAPYKILFPKFIKFIVTQNDKYEPLLFYVFDKNNA